MEVVKLIAEGNTSDEIAEALVISRKTVDHHRGHILEKLGMRNVAELSLLIPMVVLATVATIIASQAAITGSFSITRRASTARLPAETEDPAHSELEVRSTCH